MLVFRVADQVLAHFNRDEGGAFGLGVQGDGVAHRLVHGVRLFDACAKRGLGAQHRDQCGAQTPIPYRRGSVRSRSVQLCMAKNAVGWPVAARRSDTLAMRS